MALRLIRLRVRYRSTFKVLPVGDTGVDMYRLKELFLAPTDDRCKLEYFGLVSLGIFLDKSRLIF